LEEGGGILFFFDSPQFSEEEYKNNILLSWSIYGWRREV
jgi:hypothetical protein